MLTHTNHPIGTFLLVLALSAPVTPKITNLEKKLAGIDTMLSDIPFKIPGMAVGIVVDGETVFQKGYGLQDHADNSSHVTSRTLFGISSCSKPFTTYALDAVMNADHVLRWSDPVMSHIPEFRLRDVTTRNRIKVKDLVTHVSGLPAHEFAAYNSHITRQELLARIAHLEANYDLREKFQYNNLVFAIAGIVLERVTGDSWEDVVRKWVFEPLNMTLTFPSFDHAIARRKEQLEHMEPADVLQIAKPHRAAKKGSIQSMPWSNDISVAPSLSIVSCIEDMVKWIHEQLSLSGSAKQMHNVQVIIPRGTYSHELDGGETFAYGLGWMLAYHRGRQLVWCGGRMDGFVSRLILSPEENVGIVLLTNLERTRHAISRVIHNLVLRLIDILATDPTPELTAKNHKTWESQQIIKFLRQPIGQHENKTVEEGKLAVDHAEQYVGVFKNAGYGTLTVRVTNSLSLVAAHHGVTYFLFARKAKDFFTAKSVWGFTFPCSFERDFFGDVSGIRIKFQPGVLPIHFEITPAVDLFKKRYLWAFAGLYQSAESSIQFSVDEIKFLLTANGTSPYVGELQPRKRSWFRLGDRLFQFFVAEDKVPRLRVYEDDLVTVFNRTSAPLYFNERTCLNVRTSGPRLRMCVSENHLP